MEVKITDSKGMEVSTAQDRYLQILFFNKQCCHQQKIYVFLHLTALILMVLKTLVAGESKSMLYHFFV